MKVEKLNVEWKVSAGFLELARLCDETLPETVIAEIEIGDDNYVHVMRITAADGTEIDQSWLSENAGYQFSMAEQIRLRVRDDKGWEKGYFLMPRPISPAEWDALSPRQRRVAGPRPTDEQFVSRVAEVEQSAAARAEIDRRISPMLTVGGVEWRGENGAHRVYFDIFKIPRYDHRRGVVEGYYDVVADKFVSAGYQGLSDTDFAAYIAGVIQRGGDLPAFQPATYDAMGCEIREGDECVIVIPRDDSHRFSPPLDVRANVGRLVVAVQRVTGVDGLDAHWSVAAENLARPLIATGKNFDGEQSRLWMRSTSLMIVGPSGGRAQPPDLPAVGSDKKYMRKALA